MNEPARDKAPNEAKEEAVKSPAAKPATAKKGLPLSRILLVFLLAVLAAATLGLGYSSWLQQNSIEDLISMQVAVEGREQNLDSRIQDFEQQVQELNDLEASTEILLNQQNARLDNLNEELSVLRLGINTAQVSSAALLLSEAASSLRIAQQYLQLVRDLSVARTLYQRSLDLLGQIDDPAISTVENMLSADLRILDGVSEIDVQALYLQLSEISAQIESVNLASRVEPSGAFMEDQGQDQIESEGFLDSIGNFLGRYFTVRRLDVPFQTPLSPQQISFLRQSMQLQLEQAKLALLQGREDIYQESISSVIILAQQNIPDNEVRKQNILRDLRDLQMQSIGLELPRLSNSLETIESLLARNTGSNL